MPAAPADFRPSVRRAAMRHVASGACLRGKRPWLKPAAHHAATRCCQHHQRRSPNRTAYAQLGEVDWRNESRELLTGFSRPARGALACARGPPDVLENAILGLADLDDRRPPVAGNLATASLTEPSAQRTCACRRSLLLQQLLLRRAHCLCAAAASMSLQIGDMGGM
jgi:hypothetical protein